MESNEKNARATKKQRELLAFIDAFIKGNNYGPSYREIMRALGYKSVSTVAIHVNGLIAKGYLRKRDNSARSIEVVTLETAKPVSPQKQWLIDEVQRKIDGGLSEQDIVVLKRTLVLLGIDNVPKPSHPPVTKA